MKLKVSRLASIKAVRAIASLTILSFSFFRCTEDLMLSQQAPTTGLTTQSTTTLPGTVSCADCKFVVPVGMYTVDGAKLGIQPGDVIGIDASQPRTMPMSFTNIVGTATNPVIIRNCGNAQATITVAPTANFGMRFSASKYFHLTGGTQDGTYGIKISGGTIGISADDFSTNFEIDHVEVLNTGFAGIMAKTNPSCDSRTWRGNITMSDAFFHHNFVHDTGGEGFYIGNSFYSAGESTPCGVKLPGEIKNIQVYNNHTVNTGYEGIQVGCAVYGAEIHDNVIESYGLKNVAVQNNGLQIGDGTGGLCYNNYIKGGTTGGQGLGMIVLGLGDNVIYNNIIVNPRGGGIFADTRYTPGPGFKFVNNTIVNPVGDGIRLYATGAQYHHYVINNLIANPGTYSTYTAPRTGNDSYVYVLNSSVNVTVSNNWYTRATLLANYLNLGSFSTLILNNCPLVDRGTTTAASFGVTKDFSGNARPLGASYDIGAIEYK